MPDMGAGAIAAIAAGALGWSTEATIAAGVGGSLLGGLLGGGAGQGTTTWIKPPKEAQALMAKQYEREKGEIQQEASIAQASAAQSMTSRGLTNTTVQEAYKTRIGKDTASRLEDLAGRYALAQYGGYQASPAAVAGPGAFGPMLQGLAQGVGQNPKEWGGILGPLLKTFVEGSTAWEYPGEEEGERGQLLQTAPGLKGLWKTVSGFLGLGE